MRKGFYLRLALDGMRKNKRLYKPYLLTCAGMEMMFYILYSLAHSPLMRSMRGGDVMGMVLMLGTVVMLVFSLLFLLYTNSFLIRRRNREFGLYNILGMNKRSISRILLWETLISALLSLLAGLAGGLLLAKLAELFLLHMAGKRADYALSVSTEGILAALLFYGVIFGLLLIVSLARVGISRPLDLLRSESAGEKPPKANWLLAAAGVVILGAAYYLAVSIESPLTALALFFAAVLLVIVATYLLFIAGSVTLCKLLQKNRSYYYQSAHFVSVSSMAFRMKRNGAGLASICILSTMVLVMLSSTSCLYFGGERALRDQYPYDLSISVQYGFPAECTAEERERLEETAHTAAQGREKGLISYSLLEVSGSFENGYLDVSGYSRYVDVISSSAAALEHVRTVLLLPLADYNRLTGKELSLARGETLIWSSGRSYPCDSFAVEGCRTLTVCGKLKEPPFRLSSSDQIVSVLCVIVPDWEEYASEITACIGNLNDDAVTVPVGQVCSFDLPGLGEEEQSGIADSIFAALHERLGGEASVSCSALSYTENRSDFFSMYGSLFFLGIILSIVFIAAAALIIYYKQISEGFEDQNRFGIMQKVGMTKDEIRAAVNSQVRTVFFAPLLLAGLHLAFAFPFVQKIIRLFGVMNTPLLLLTSAVCFLIFALFYVFVYRRTAKAYYSIVSD